MLNSLSLFRQAKLQAADSLPYGNSGIANSNVSVDANGRKSESELPLTASFQTAGFQQWDSQGRAVGYAPDPTLYAPQPQRPVKITAPPSVSSQRSTPVMSERLDARTQPIRSNTGGSSASWDVQAQVGPNSYQMSQQHSQYPDPTPLPPRIPPPTSPTTAPSNMEPRASPTPTQAHFPYPGDAARVASPHTAPAYAPPQGPPPQAYPPPLPSDAQRGAPGPGQFMPPANPPYYSGYSGH